MSFDDLSRDALKSLHEAFPHVAPQQQHTSKIRNVSIGIEIECSWKSYFPDLWVEGFPNIDRTLLQSITDECATREKTLLPLLQKTSDCGIKRGADKYWEFAFPPVHDPSITCSQVQFLKDAKMIPPGKHSLHITIGGLKLNKNAVYLATLLESFSCSPERIMQGFHPSYPDTSSASWGRKGQAGCFEKIGSNDLQGDCEFATEIRTLVLPETTEHLLSILEFAQDRAEEIITKNPNWNKYFNLVKTLLTKYDLPDTNWQKPHEDPTSWRKYAECYQAFSSDIRRCI